MTLVSTILTLISTRYQDHGCAVKSLLAHEELRKFDKSALDAALMGAKATGRVKLVLGSLIPSRGAHDQEYRRYRKKCQRAA